MKTIITILALLIAAITGFAQDSGQATVVVAANVTSNTPVGTLTIDCRRQQNVAVEWEFELSGSGTDTIGIRWVPSATASAIPTTPTLADGFYMVSAANGATTVRVATNFNVKGFPYLHGYYITNASASRVLTNRVRYWVKPNAP